MTDPDVTETIPDQYEHEPQQVEDILNSVEDEEDDTDGEGPATIKMPPFEMKRVNIADLLTMIETNQLDLNPHYQRDVVWNQSNMSNLIDSILQGYYVPPVIFNIQAVLATKGFIKTMRNCVDGKQRLTAIREFRNGNIPCMIDGKKHFFMDPEAERDHRPSTKRLLKESVKIKFLLENFHCVEYQRLSQSQEIDMFQRVQMGRPLTKAENLRSTQGKWQMLARCYEHRYAEVVDRESHYVVNLAMLTKLSSQTYACL